MMQRGSEDRTEFKSETLNAIGSDKNQVYMGGAREEVDIYYGRNHGN